MPYPIAGKVHSATQKREESRDGMTDLEKLYHWLRQYPDWGGFLQIDRLEDNSDGIGIFPRGLEEISRQEDVQGNLRIACRYRFELIRRVHHMADSRENTQWLLDFQNWVQQQSVAGEAPCFGDVPAAEKLQAQKGTMQKHGITDTFTVTLIADFMKVYEVN